MSSVPAAGTPVDWPKDSQKFDIYINEEGMYELLFSSQQPKAKDSRAHLSIGLKTHKRLTFTSMKKGCMSYYFPVNSLRQRFQKTLLQCVVSSCLAAAYTQNEGRPTSHQRVGCNNFIADLKNDDDLKNNDDLKNCEYENVGLQGETR